jgi:hypothetical protein
MRAHSDSKILTLLLTDVPARVLPNR